MSERRQYPRSRSSKSDHLGLQVESQSFPQENIFYDVVTSPRYRLTRALFIGNLRRPLDAHEFQKYLRLLAVIATNEVDTEDGVEFVIERAWLNRSRTHGIVLVNDERGAEFIREKLNGSKYPTEADDLRYKEEYYNRAKERHSKELKQYETTSKPVTVIKDEEIDLENIDRNDISESPAPRKLDIKRYDLYVDYIPVKVINQWIFEEDRGPKNAQWKFHYQQRGEDTFAVHELVEGDFKPHYDNVLHHPKYGQDRGRGPYRGKPNEYYAERSSYVPRADTYHGETKSRSYGSFKKIRSRSQSLARQRSRSRSPVRQRSRSRS